MPATDLEFVSELTKKASPERRLVKPPAGTEPAHVYYLENAVAEDLRVREWPAGVA